MTTPPAAPASGALDGARPLSLEDRAAVAELRQVLDAADYTPAGIRRALGTEDVVMSREEDIPVHLRRLGDDELSTLIRLFVLDANVSARAAERALAPLGLERVARLGVVRVDGDDVAACVRIVPHDETLIVSDRRLRRNAPGDPEHVAGVHGPSVTLSHLTVRRPAASALDLGTGCGVQAIRAASHCRRIVATDVNARALGFAAFNAALNGVENVELRHGSGFAPVERERFDLVVSNPPYVISPESRWAFRDSGLAGDSLSERLVRELPAHLVEGAFATILVSWILRHGEQGVEPVERWLDGAPCDAWLLHYKTEEPLEAAASWNLDVRSSDRESYGSAIDRWLEYFRRLGAEAIGYGAVVLRRRSSGPSWVRTDALPLGRLGPASDHILRVYAAEDFLRGLAHGRALLDSVFSLAPRTRIEQTRRLRGGEFEVAETTLVLGEGLGFRGEIDDATTAVLSRLDGRRPLRAALAEAAAMLGLDGDDSRALEEEALPLVAQLLRLGFLEPPADLVEPRRESE